jgi:molybdate transport system ATP-binding protein
VIETRGLTAHAGSFVLRDASIAVPTGAYGVVIGPAGSGKTTLLESIAGVRRVHAGEVWLHGRDVTRTPAEHRELAIVYQQGFLFPHLDVLKNVGYGAVDEATTRDVCSRFGVGALASRETRGLSGGERQLVALARALATRPRVLLLDEPFAALDPRRRVAARRELRTLHREWGFTVLQVTHDFAEAGALGDVAMLLDGGRILQQGSPAELFRKPATRFAAEFLGAENVWDGTVVGGPARGAPPETQDTSSDLTTPHHSLAPDAESSRLLRFHTGNLVLHVVGDAPEGPAHAVLRAEDVLLSRGPLATSARNQFEGTVAELASSGAIVSVTVSVAGVPIVALLTAQSVAELELRVGAPVWVAFKAAAVHLC